MKVCPQCRSVFGDDFVYCSNDGTVLVEENLPLPTEAGDDAEAETVIRRKGEPIVVDFNELSAAQAETAEINNLPPTQSARPIVVEKSSNSKLYALFLLIGLLLGGSLVLATLLATKYINRPNTENAGIQTNENNSQKTENTIDERGDEADRLADELHQKRTDKPDEDFNGRVIVENANVRSAPSSNANQIDILPAADRITIERRENADSPWYFVSCEHGIGGWMHGNTIEFTDGNF